MGIIQEEAAKNRIVVTTLEGPVAYDIDEFCEQPADGILYDLNRDTLTTSTLLTSGEESLPLIRLVNDYAAALVIKHLKKKIHSLKKMSNENDKGISD